MKTMRPRAGTGRSRLQQAIDDRLADALRKDDRLMVLAPLPSGPTAAQPLVLPAALESLQGRFGTDRILALPYAASTVTGIALGAAAQGRTVVLDMTHLDRPWGLGEELARSRAALRASNETAGPALVVRAALRGTASGAVDLAIAAQGGALAGAVSVVLPSGPQDGADLMGAALGAGKPVVVLEPDLPGAADPRQNAVPLPLEHARLLRDGLDLTVVALSGLVGAVAPAAADLERIEGLSCAVIDPRCLAPLDGATILDSVARTGKLLILEDGPAQSGLGVPISALVAEQGPDRLLAPIRRMTVAPDEAHPAALIPLLREAAWGSAADRRL